MRIPLREPVATLPIEPAGAEIVEALSIETNAVVPTDAVLTLIVGAVALRDVSLTGEQTQRDGRAYRTFHKFSVARVCPAHGRDR